MTLIIITLFHIVERAQKACCAGVLVANMKRAICVIALIVRAIQLIQFNFEKRAARRPGRKMQASENHKSKGQ